MSRCILIVSTLLCLPAMAPAQNSSLTGWALDGDSSQRLGVTVRETMAAFEPEAGAYGGGSPFGSTARITLP